MTALGSVSRIEQQPFPTNFATKQASTQTQPKSKLLTSKLLADITATKFVSSSPALLAAVGRHAAGKVLQPA